jgi:hypothetical protein
MYKVVRAFRDSKNNDYYYRVGDTYPVAGYKPTKARITELVKGTNTNGRIYLEEVKGASAPDTEE